ncbi:DUF7657 domain-containing protein [Microbacterium ureisolvens]|uniref:4-amino-4-deoxy-L-arabinose transferase n=1 Tax=Microbacterium ureisolvens TaxID=2781186 RepID=A0ABS7I2H4_9MICO|nr:hypothetical protein [Microbacterium ureisolvens]MBW9111867.1 hypothetical protein [Microbacterium ureisolvens]
MSAPPVVTDPASRAPSPPEDLSARRRRRVGLLVFVVPTLLYLVLILLGATTSNIGISALREDPQHPLGLHLGGYQSVRADEFGTGSPIWLGQITRNGNPAELPLSASGDLFAQLPTGPVSGAVFFESTLFHLAPLVPAEMLFALKWWLPTYLLFLGVPVLLRQVSGRLRWGYLAAVVIAASPATAWWSGIPVNTLGFVTAGCALAVYGARSLSSRNWLVSAGAFVAAGILLARTPTYYQPTAIVVGLPIVLATAVLILTDRSRLRTRIAAIAAVTASGLAWTAGLFWESRDAIASGLSTVYPGLRQSGGQALDPGFVFGATNLGWLRFQTVGASSNQSEITTSYLALAAAVIVVLLMGRIRGGARSRWIILAVTIPTLFWAAWALLSWGEWSATIPVINRVPANRAAMGVGYLAVVAFCITMSLYRVTTPRRHFVTAAVSGASVAALSAWGGISLVTSGLIAELAPWMITLSAVVSGLAVFVLVRWPGRAWSMLVGGAAAAAVTITAQPVTLGLGDLRESPSARQMLSWGESSRQDGTLWAADSAEMVSLMTATAVPSLSYRQQIGPNPGRWELLDPTRAHESMWNRGGTHIEFEWADSGIEFEQPYADTVVVRASPCAVQERITELRHIVSIRPLDASCLIETDRLTWSGRIQYVYDVVPEA